VRRQYLDWLRGVAVLIMIEAHTVDSWTRAADRTGPAYAWALIVGGFGAPIFLFLAGIAVALAAGSRRRKGLSPSAVSARAQRRGWQIFGLAFLFRFQSWVISRGPFAATLLKVDILNVMGPAMLMSAFLWGLARNDRTRAALAAGAAILIAMATPLVREWPLLSALPDPVEWYLRPVPGRATFTIFPWAGFLLAGTAIGLWLDAVREPKAERRLNLLLGAIGAGIAVAGYGSSFLPAIYPQTSFWTSSPTFFFLRLGILVIMLPLAFEWTRLWRGWSPVTEFGVASLFVYWIHVEMVYGVPSAALHRQLSFPQVAVAYLAFTVFLFGLAKLKEHVVAEIAVAPSRTRASSQTARNGL
jgi:uncharacterized membrane protein